MVSRFTAVFLSVCMFAFGAFGGFSDDMNLAFMLSGVMFYCTYLIIDTMVHLRKL